MSQHKIIQQLEKLIEIGIALSSETHHDVLLEKILLGAKLITNADGSTLYRVKGGVIEIVSLHNTSLGIYFGGASGKPVNLPTIPLYLPDGAPNLKNVVSYSYHFDKTVNIVDAYDDTVFDFSGTRQFDRQNHYQSRSFLAVPMKNHQRETIGILQLINALDETSGAIICFDAISQRITEAFASQAAAVLTKQQLIIDLENMFTSLIQLIATAIDEKSPYTGGHCRRVPELTMMLAEAVHDTQEGYLKNFRMKDSDRYELEIAGWLHDCGKITTPEHIIDKATKLETIFDRVHLVDARIEILQRDRMIAHLEQRLAALEAGQPLDPAVTEAYRHDLAVLDDARAFVRRVNIGGEAMTEEDLRRVEALKAYSLTIAGQAVPLLSDEEAYNLSIRRGTLTAEERQVINDHIKVTIAMLEAIKFPTHLKNVPEYAGGHHERMDGKGYPKGLKREEMSIPARIMAIADIFEALTAKDRPYKPAKKLSEALAILKKMKEQHHIDPDIYDAFIAHKVYRRYGEKFLEPYQLDVD